MVIEQRKENLLKHRLGAVASYSELCLIWVTMIPKPECNKKHAYSLTRKFNSVLEDVISGDKRSHILKVYLDHHNNLFDRSGNLTPDGFIAFWNQIDHAMSEFERGKTELAPRSSRLSQSTYQPSLRHNPSMSYQHSAHHNHSSNSRYKWTKD